MSDMYKHIIQTMLCKFVLCAVCPFLTIDLLKFYVSLIHVQTYVHCTNNALYCVLFLIKLHYGAKPTSTLLAVGKIFFL